MSAAVVVRDRRTRAARPQVRVDAFHGSLPTLFHLPTQEGPWVGVTVIMAQRLAAQAKVATLPALGLLVVPGLRSRLSCRADGSCSARTRSFSAPPRARTRPGAR